MPGLEVSFHATPDELLAFVKDCAYTYGLHVVVIKHFPFEATEIMPTKLDEVFQSAPISRIAFTIEKPVLLAATGNKFADLNPDRLMLDVGKRNPKGLTESSLSARTQNLEAIEVWRKAANKLKSITACGATVVNPDTGAVANARNHRYTVGAKALELEGVPMLTLTGNVYRLGDSK